MFLIIVSACSPQETNENEISPGLPLAWIIHQGDKYVLSEVYSDGEVGMEDVASIRLLVKEMEQSPGKKFSSNRRVGIYL